MAVYETPEGYLVVDATLSRTGIYEYSAGEMRRMGVPIADKVPNEAIVRIYRDGKEVFDADALKSFELKPATIKHPSKQVDRGSFRDLMHGVIGAPVVADGAHTRTKVQLMSDQSIKLFRRGQTQLSAGYTAVLDMTPGRAPDGTPYDGRQTKIVGNHVALVPAGRAGTAQLGDTVAVTDGAKDMADEKTHVDAVAFGELKQQHADMTLQLDALKKERDSLAGEVEALKGSAVSDEEIKKRIADGVAAELAARDSRARVVDKAKQLAPRLTVSDSDSERTIMEQAIKAHRSDVVFDGQSDDFVRGMFDSLQPVATPKIRTSSERPNAFGDSVPSYQDLRALVR
jgi:hypothetical protein